MPFAKNGYISQEMPNVNTASIKPITKCRQIPLYAKYPHLINLVRNDLSMQNIESKFPFLLNNFEELTSIKKWSKAELGINNRIQDHEIAQKIGWKIRQIDSNSWEYIQGQNRGIGPNT